MFNFWKRNTENSGSEKLRHEIEDKQKKIERLKSEIDIKEKIYRENKKYNNPHNPECYFQMDPINPSSYSEGLSGINSPNFNTNKINEHPIRKVILDLGFNSAKLEFPHSNLDFYYEQESLDFQVKRKLLEINRRKRVESSGDFRVNLN